MDEPIFDHGLPDNNYNKHAWILGQPEIGERVWIGAFCLIDALYAPLKIGRGTDVSSGVKIMTHSTVRRCISEKQFSGIDSSDVTIGEFCFIGTNAVILRGAKIGHHSVIGAGCVVKEGMRIPPYSLVVGVPAKIIGSSKKFLKGLAKASLSVVIPAFNEEQTLAKVVKEAVGFLRKLLSDYEVVIINDGSSDRTKSIANSLARKNKRIRVVHHQVNKGFTGAMKTSFKSASKDFVFLAPADGQFNFEELKLFWEAIRGFDVAIGYRVERDYGLVRGFNSKLFHLLCRVMFDIKFKEISTVSMWRRTILDDISIQSDDRSALFLPELISKALKKSKFAEVPIHWRLRQGGQAKGANPKVILKTLVGMVGLWYRTKYRQ